MATVDPKARVFPVQELRSSIAVRHTPLGHTQVTTYVHAKKLVADVMKDLGYGTARKVTIRTDERV